MNTYATDTVSLVRFLSNTGHLGKSAKKFFREADEGSCVIIIPAVVLMEILYLSEKARITTAVADVVNLVKDSSNYNVADLTPEIILKAKEITDIKDLHDRMIAATAAFHNVSLITCDEEIIKSKHVKCVW